MSLRATLARLASRRTPRYAPLCLCATPALLTVLAGCTLNAGLDQGPCYEGRERVNGSCQDLETNSRQPQALPSHVDPWTSGSLNPLECQLRLQSPTLQFGQVSLQREAQAVLVITNHGHRPCALAAALMSVDSAPAFVLADAFTAGVTVQPQQSVPIGLSFRPQQIGAATGRVLFHGEGGAVGWADVRGEGVAPSSALHIEPSRVDYGHRRYDCTVPSPRPIYITNPSDRDTVVRWSSGSGPFSAHGADVQHLIPAGRTATVTVDFFPRLPGQSLGQLRVEHDAAPARTVFLSGRGNDQGDNREVFPASADLYLNGRPVLDSVRVFVDGVELAARARQRTMWSLDAAARHLRLFVDLRPEQMIEVSYVQHCAPRSCGDGVVNAGEFCDDGNADDRDDCLSSCEFATCGDGVIRAGVETCDDGNTLGGDGCNWACQVELCGNGTLEPPEQCDEGAANSDTRPDACRTNCRYASCRDGVLDDGEFCDDGNADINDACVYCRWAECGDGVLHRGVEECDDGNLVNTDACKNDCSLPAFEVGLEITPPQPLPPDSTILTSSVVSMPFDFSFLGAPVTEISLAQPGLVLFGEAFGLSANNAPVGTSTAPNGYIALWWDDLQTTDPAAGPDAKVRYALLGQSPHRVLVLRFEELRFDGAALTMEMQLFEGSSAIAVHYSPLNIDPRAYPGASATVGWESADGLRGMSALACSPSCTLADWPSDQVIHYTP